MKLLQTNGPEPTTATDGCPISARQPQPYVDTCPTRPGIFISKPPVDEAAATFPNRSTTTTPIVSNLKKSLE